MSAIRLAFVGSLTAINAKLAVVNNKYLIISLLFAILLCGAGCAANNNTWPGSYTPAALPAQGSVSAGQALFQSGTLHATACSSCHIVAPDTPMESGPSLVGVADRANAGWAGHSAEDYLFRAIVYPNAHLLSGYSAGLMPDTYGQLLTAQQLRDLITYLLTLKSGA